MIEYPESKNLSGQLRDAVSGRVITDAFPPTKPHKFCWFDGDPASYAQRLSGHRIVSASGFGMFVDIEFDGGLGLCVNDGVNMRLTSEMPKDYQLYLKFIKGPGLAFSVAMYGGIVLHDANYDNSYYINSKAALQPASAEFAPHFRRLIAEAKPVMSAKAFLATQQRFPGLGNGVLQDILFNSGIHPKRKIGTLSEEEREKMLQATVSTLGEMARLGGRDTEKDIFGNPGSYKTLMSKNTAGGCCPVCGSPIVKEAYMGGSVYYCPVCQKI